MISDNRSIQQLAALLIAHDIRQAVLCPGSRNAAITHTLTQLPEIQTYTLTDERSAGFFALGLAQAFRRPVAICVTSGSALLNLHPAVAEAYYQHIPLIVISADRPQAWINQMDGQTLPQPGVFRTLVRKSVQLPEIHTPTDDWHANRLINEALLAAARREGGPVHINIPIAEPFYEFHTGQLPEVRVIRQGSCPDLSDKKCLIIVGQQQDNLPLPQGYAVLSEHIGNLQGGIRGNLDTLIATIPEEETAAYRPEVVITLGGHIVSKQLKRFLRNHPPRHHIHVSPAGEVADVFQCLTHIVAQTAKNFLLALPSQQHTAMRYAGLWEQLAERRRAAQAQATADEEEQAVGTLIRRLPADAVLHVANSSAVRLIEKFPLRPSVKVLCNRGVNGIEGSLSTAVGYAAALPERSNFVIIGDLSFFYDQNALWNRALPQNLHILLLNNGGGRIFDTLPIPDDERSRQAICGTHCTAAEPVCRQYGLRYLQGLENMDAFLSSSQSILLEINHHNHHHEKLENH